MTEKPGLSEEELQKLLRRPSVESRATDVGKYGPDAGTQTRRIQEQALEGVAMPPLSDLLGGAKRLGRRLTQKRT